jgi:hypothetical protein
MPPRYKNCNAKTAHGPCKNEVNASSSLRCTQHYRMKSMSPGIKSPVCNARTIQGSPCQREYKKSKSIRCPAHFRKRSNKRSKRRSPRMKVNEFVAEVIEGNIPIVEPIVESPPATLSPPKANNDIRTRLRSFLK